MLSEGELDRERARIYSDFHEQNRELFDTDRQEYFSQQRRYVERNLLRVKYPEMKNSRGQI